MFLQAFTTCQPEHGVPDDMALHQAQRVRDSRGVPEFVFDPRKGESYQEALDMTGNPSRDLDWYETKDKVTGEARRYTVAHWCTTEARFRNHLKKVKPEQAEKLIPLDNMLVRITQQDVVLPPLPQSVATLVHSGLRRVHYARRERQDRVPRPVTAVSHVLRGAPQGMAHAAVQGRHQEPRLRGAEGYPRGCGCRQDREGRILRPRPRMVQEKLGSLVPAKA